MDATLSGKPTNNWKTYWLLLKIAVIAYIGIYFISELTLKFIVPVESINPPPIDGTKGYWFALAFLLFSTPIIYFGNCLLGGGLIKLKFDRLMLYLGLTMFLGSGLELVVNHLFVLAIDRPSWLYHVWPKYGGFTSGVTFIMWPLYGFHLLCFHHAMTKRKSPLVSTIPVRGIMLGIDAMIMEMIANLFSLIGFKSYYFYYLFGDLNHFTTIEIFIPYVIVGFFTMSVFYFLDRPKIPKIIIGITCLIAGWCILYFG
jgi:hypothetical protein